MKKSRNKIFLVYLLLISILPACQPSLEKSGSRVEYLPYFDEDSFTPKWITPGSDSLNDFHKIPDFSLINQEGDSISQKDLEGKVYIANFFFTSCPGICPQMSDNMRILQEEFLKDDRVMLLSYSVTPDRDTVDKLKGFAERRKIDSNKWLLLTGDRQQIYNLGRDSYFIEENMGIEKTIDDFLHTENFVLIDSEKHIRGIYNGLNRTSVDQLIVDIKALEKEKSAFI